MMKPNQFNPPAFAGRTKPEYKAQTLISGIIRSVEYKDPNATALWLQWGHTAKCYDWYEPELMAVLNMAIRYGAMFLGLPGYDLQLNNHYEPDSDLVPDWEYRFEPGSFKPKDADGTQQAKTAWKGYNLKDF